MLSDLDKRFIELQQRYRQEFGKRFQFDANQVYDEKFMKKFEAAIERGEDIIDFSDYPEDVKT